MHSSLMFHKKKILFVFVTCMIGLVALCGRIAYLMILQGDYYREKATQLHQRERSIKAKRGKILDCNGIVLADNRTVCTVSVVHSQITDKEQVIHILAEKLAVPQGEVRKRVEKVSALERIKINVPKETGDAIRDCHLDGVKVDEDYKRFYPFGTLASKVLGFTGADNQGIVGLEVAYDKYLQGIDGKILTFTDARGIELDRKGESRIEPAAGYDLQTSIDYNIQMYASQAARRVLEEKQAEQVSVILMNPSNGEIMAMVNLPEYDLNDPFTLITRQAEGSSVTDALNRMWRNPSINDTYEPGSTFKIFTASAGLEAGIVTPEDTFFCSGCKSVEDRRIHCHKRTGHGSETFVQGIENSCNPVFIEVALRLGIDNEFNYLRKFHVLEKTGIDLPGEAGTIMHTQEDVGLVELATMAFGQSFQITPLQLISMASMVVNGGYRITPHFGIRTCAEGGGVREVFTYGGREQVLSAEISQTMRELLEKVVSEGSGHNAYIEGYRIGGKTATSQTLPRSSGRYISSFIGFAPADDPQVIGLIVITNPQGLYYGGLIAAPVMKDIFTNILPYLGIDKTT